MNDYVQIPAYTDRWMMGDRFGKIVKVTKQRKTRASILRERHLVAGTEIAHVKLDVSGKTVRVILADCTFVD
jgi:hypothetical protein